MAERILALDIGTKKIGVAVSDAGNVIATPLAAIDTAGLRRDADRVIDLVKEYSVKKIILGLPQDLPETIRFTHSCVARATGIHYHIENFARKLANKLRSSALPDIEIDFVDERWTTAEAREILEAKGVRGKTEQKKQVDSVAAAVMLREYLDAR